MQFRGLLFLGLVLAAEGADVARFRAAPINARLVRRASDTASSEAVANPTSTAVQVVTATSTAAAEVSSSDTPDSTSSAAAVVTSQSSNDSGSSTSSAEADSTVTKTVTVTDANADTITTSTTILKTLTSTVVVTSTTFKTATVTSSGDTATSTVYETSTQWANQKRALNLAPRTVAENGIVVAEPMITDAPDLDDEEFELLRPRDMLHKRATVTVTKTVTVGDSSDKTVTKSVTRTVISTISSASKITKTLTETEQADASTTVTVTSTLVVTSTKVTTNVVQTATVAPSGSYGDSGSSSSDSSSSSGSSSSGLSTGAKAGIGAGAGVAGLIVLALLLWCCMKRRNKPSKSEIDDMFGSSEVPVGHGPVRDSSARISSHMSQISPTIPNVTPVKTPAPEGYRGTALGDGRAGYAKPKPFGAAYAPAVSPEHTYSRTATATSAGDERMDVPPPGTAVELGNDGSAAKWHQVEAAEIDGNQVTSPRGTAPPEHVYEMPSQQYR